MREMITLPTGHFALPVAFYAKGEQLVANVKKKKENTFATFALPTITVGRKWLHIGVQSTGMFVLLVVWIQKVHLDV